MGLLQFANLGLSTRFDQAQRSVFNGLGSGHDAYFYGLTNPRSTGQWGVSLKWQTQDVHANFDIPEDILARITG